MQEFSSKEKYLLTNTLNCLPVILRGKSVLIDLHNEISVAGRIVSADGYMNICLEEAVLIDRNGLQYAYDKMMVRDRKIKQIHIPDHIDVKREMEDWLTNGWLKYKPRPNRPQRPTFKTIRAERRHKEVLEELIKAQNQEQKD